KTSQESKTVPEFEKKSEDGNNKNHTTIIYNIIQYNISVYVNGEKPEYSEADKEVPLNGQDIESMDFVDDAITETDEPESKSDEKQKHVADIKTASSSKKDDLIELQDSSINLRGFTRGKKSTQEMDDDSKEFNPRGPNFLPEVPDPDAETVD
nr:hypothetical protein [Tanacetum cinerariifolium]